MDIFDQHLGMSADDWKVKGDDAAATRDFKTAIDCCSKAIDLDPTNHVHFSNRSAAYLSNHDAMQALADAEKCIQLKPSWAKGYGQKGAALYELGDFDNSIRTYKQGLVVKPDSTHLKEGLADVQNSAREYSCPSAASMLQAVATGNLPGINALLRMGCGVNEFLKIGCEEVTPLGVAVGGLQEGAVKLLLAAGADPNLGQHVGGAVPVPPIKAPVLLGHAGIVELMIKAGASVHAHFDADQQTLLHAAAYHGHVEVARLLLAAGARVDARSKAHRLPPVARAVQCGHAGVVELLIKAGASVHEHVNENQMTLLHSAAGEDHVEVVRVLLAAGARVDVLTKTGMSPIALATEYGHAGVVELLVKAGASVHEHANEGHNYTLLHFAAHKGHVEVVRVLLAAGARVDIRTKEGHTPLLSCLESRLATTAEGLAAARKIMKLLVKAGADVNARDTDTPGLSVLHAAAMLCCPGIVQDLLDAGAKIDAKDNRGESPQKYVGFSPYGDSKPAKRVADTKAVLKRWKRTQAAGGGGKRQARTERGGIAVGSSGGAGAGAGVSGSSLVLKGHFSGEVQDKKKKKKKKKKAVKDENRVCDGPDCNSLGVNRCKACKRPAYCGVECQRAHWNAGHKQECKLWREE